MSNFQDQNEAKLKNEGRIDEKRRAMSKAGLFTPLIMTLASKTALGQGANHCSPSGMQSGNLSHADPTINCAVGTSANDWMQNADQIVLSGSGDMDDWKTAGCIPFKIRLNALIKEYKKPNCPTGGTWFASDSVYDTFISLGTKPTKLDFVFGSGSTTGPSLWRKLACSPGTLESVAIAVYLNKKLNIANGSFSPAYDQFTQADVVGLYQLGNGDILTYTPSSGATLDSTFDVFSFFSSLLAP